MDNGFDFSTHGMNKELSLKIIKFVETEARAETDTFIDLLASLLKRNGGRISKPEMVMLLESYSAGVVYSYAVRDEEVIKAAEKLFGAKFNGESDAS